jgi:hypothetical protein
MCGIGDAPNPIDRVDSSSWYFAAICRSPSDEATDPYKTPTNLSPISTNVDCGDDEEIIAWIPSPSNEPPHGKLDTRILTDNANDSAFERLTLHTRPFSNPLLSKSLKFQKRSSRSEIHFAPYQPTRSSSVDHLADKMKRWNMRNAPSQQPQLLIDFKTPAESWIYLKSMKQPLMLLFYLLPTLPTLDSTGYSRSVISSNAAQHQSYSAYVENTMSNYYGESYNLFNHIRFLFWLHSVNLRITRENLIHLLRLSWTVLAVQ